MFDLTGRVAVVTGGGGALGKSIAVTLAEAGCDVIILGRSGLTLDNAIQTIKGVVSTRVHKEVCDVTSENSLIETCDRIIANFTKIDILVTCAAAGAASEKFEDITYSDWKDFISTDLDGVFLSCKVFGKSMLSESFGRIINLTSFHNVATYPYRVAYNTAKSGVEGLSRALAVEWGHSGITVNTIAPGPILTPRTQWFLDQDEKNKSGMLSRTPNVQLGSLHHVSSAVLYLSSLEAGHLNGQRIVIDGGWTSNAWWGDHAALS